MKKNNRKILILYSQLAGYLVSNLNYFLELNPESQIDIIYYPKSTNAPFDFQLHDNIKLHERKKYSNKSLTKLVDNINPDVALVSGWFDNSYLKISKKLKKNGKLTVCVIDNFFTGSIRQIFGLFPLKLLVIIELLYRGVFEKGSSKGAIKMSDEESYAPKSLS